MGPITLSYSGSFVQRWEQVPQGTCVSQRSSSSVVALVPVEVKWPSFIFLPQLYSGKKGSESHDQRA